MVMKPQARPMLKGAFAGCKWCNGNGCMGCDEVRRKFVSGVYFTSLRQRISILNFDSLCLFSCGSCLSWFQSFLSLQEQLSDNSFPFNLWIVSKVDQKTEL